MTSPVQTLTAGRSNADAAARLAGPHSAHPLMDGDHCAGMATRTDVLLRAGHRHRAHDERERGWLRPRSRRFPTRPPRDEVQP